LVAKEEKGPNKVTGGTGDRAPKGRVNLRRWGGGEVWGKTDCDERPSETYGRAGDLWVKSHITIQQILGVWGGRERKKGMGWSCGN